MPFRVTGGSANSSGTSRIFQAGTGDLDAWITIQPGSPDLYIGGTSSVDQYSGLHMTAGMQFHFDLRTGDELWMTGTGPATSSIAQALIRTA